MFFPTFSWSSSFRYTINFPMLPVLRICACSWVMPALPLVHYSLQVHAVCSLSTTEVPCLFILVALGMKPGALHSTAKLEPQLKYYFTNTYLFVTRSIIVPVSLLLLTQPPHHHHQIKQLRGKGVYLVYSSRLQSVTGKVRKPFNTSHVPFPVKNSENECAHACHCHPSSSWLYGSGPLA